MRFNPAILAIFMKGYLWIQGCGKSDAISSDGTHDSKATPQESRPRPGSGSVSDPSSSGKKLESKTTIISSPNRKFVVITLRPNLASPEPPETITTTNRSKSPTNKLQGSNGSSSRSKPREPRNPQNFTRSTGGLTGTHHAKSFTSSPKRLHIPNDQHVSGQRKEEQVFNRGDFDEEILTPVGQAREIGTRRRKQASPVTISHHTSGNGQGGVQSNSITRRAQGASNPSNTLHFPTRSDIDSVPFEEYPKHPTPGRNNAIAASAIGAGDNRGPPTNGNRATRSPGHSTRGDTNVITPPATVIANPNSDIYSRDNQVTHAVTHSVAPIP